MAVSKVLHPDKVSKFFTKYFKALKPKPLTGLSQLHALADKVASSKTKDGAWVFNRVYQTARQPQEIFRSTVWRDKEITKDHLKTVKKVTQKLLTKKIKLYTFWIRSGSGNQTKIWQLIFSQKGAPLVLTASIMMEPLFKNPASFGLKIEGIYFGVPEIIKLIDSKFNTLILLNVGKDRLCNVWAGGTDYPGEIYKPICQAHNGWVYDSNGFEIHGAAFIADYLNKKAKKEKTLVVITGLSLHGKSALSTTNGVQPGYFEDFTRQQEVIFKGIHDDYVAFLPLNKQKTRWEIFCHVPYGLFPACHGEKSDSPLVANNRTALFSVFVNKKGVPDFNQNMNNTNNQRAASPIDTLEVFRNGDRQVKNFDKVVIFILTRNNFCPSGIIFHNPIDFAWSYAGVVVQKTDAIKGDFPAVYYNFGCTDFDVVPRHKYLERIVKAFSNFSVPVTLAMLNTGAPGPEESMRVRDAIASGWHESDLDKKLGVEVVTKVPGFKDLYLPWKQGGYSYKKVVDAWQKQRKKRRQFMMDTKIQKTICSPEKLAKLIGKPKALV